MDPESQMQLSIVTNQAKGRFLAGCLAMKIAAVNLKRH
jgi:hypothetical protein